MGQPKPYPCPRPLSCVMSYFKQVKEIVETLDVKQTINFASANRMTIAVHRSTLQPNIIFLHEFDVDLATAGK